MSRTTKAITYNLNDRGRQHTGKDRSNVDVQSMIKTINSGAIQEQVNSGTFTGFCGHQIRQRYGMIPPETAIIDGKTILLEPAIRTVYLKAEDDGTVTHKQEFLENDAGEHVLRQYKAKVGGFSTAVNYLIQGQTLFPNVFAGFDYVFAPNFLDNASIGLFDSAMQSEAMPLINSMLEHEIVSLFDSMGESNQSWEYMEAMSLRARKAETELRRLKKDTALRVKKAQRLEQDAYDSALCSNTIDFNTQLQMAEQFLNYQAEPAEKPAQAVNEQKADVMLKALSNFMGIRQ